MRLARLAALATLALALLVTPLAAEAPPAGKVPRIGFLAPGPTPMNVAALREGLRELGYVEPTNLILEARWGDGRLDRLPELAADLVRFGIDVIVTDSTAAALAAKEATATIPIVMGTGSSDPVGRGLAASIARPGGNVTGLTLPSLNGKRLELLKEAVPSLTRVAYIWNPANPGGQNDVRNAEAAARTLGLQLHPLGVKSDGDLDAAFARAGRDGVRGLVVMADFVLYGLRGRIVELAAQYRLPGIYETKAFVEAGGLLAYGVNVPANFRRAAALVDKILKGAKPADLPIESPARIELFVNLKAAKGLSLTIPPSVLARADEVIE
jgi:putative tryptophan/tyrosine transport system substrate-binding protein